MERLNNILVFIMAAMAVSLIFACYGEYRMKSIQEHMSEWSETDDYFHERHKAVSDAIKCALGRMECEQRNWRK